MTQIEKRHFDAAGAMAEVFAARLGKDRAVHPETVIASAARMAGTMLFRSFNFDTSTMPPGACVLSVEANEKGPELVNIVTMMLGQYGLQLDEKKLNAGNRGEPPKPTVLETQRLLGADLEKVRQQHQLGLQDGARACALTTAWLIRECSPQIGPEVGYNVAIYGFIEGTKTVPYSEDKQKPNEKKRAWYQFWK
jgi:hypothetical protein